MITKEKILEILRNNSQKSVVGWAVEEADFNLVADDLLKNCSKTSIYEWTLIEKTLPPLNKRLLFRDKYLDWQEGTYDGKSILVEDDGTMELSEFIEWFEPPF